MGNSWKRVFWSIFIGILIILLILIGYLSGARGIALRNQGQPKKDEPDVQLEVWTFFDMNTPDAYYVDLWQTMAQEYGYSVNVETYSTQQIKDKLKIAAVKKELPDIFLVWGGTYPEFLFESGACIPVQDYLEQEKPEFLDSYWQEYADGNHYIVPCLPEAYAVTYANTELMRKMNLTMPTTWEELVALIGQVNEYSRENGTDYAAIELGDKDSWLGELLYCMIVNRMDPYAFDRLWQGEIDFSEDIFAQAAQKVEQLTDMQAFPEDYLETGEVEAVQNFIDGEAVLFPHQSTIIYYLMNHMGEDAFEVAQFPSCSELTREDYETCLMDINHTQRPGLCICSYSGHPDEAAELCIDFAQRVNEINVTQYGYINITKEDLTAPQELPDPVMQLHEMLDNEKKCTAYWYALLAQEDADTFRSLTKKLYAGEYDAAEFLQEGEPVFRVE